MSPENDLRRLARAAAPAVWVRTADIAAFVTEHDRRIRDFAATWHVAYGHEGHLDDCNWSTCLGLLTGDIKRGSDLAEEGAA